jgi:Fe-S cluster biogenesis protein NfuA
VVTETLAAIDRAAVERALDEIRPYLHGDGGGIEVVEIAGDEVRVRLQGSCADCTMQQVTMKAGVERILRARIPAVRSVVSL